MFDTHVSSTFGIYLTVNIPWQTIKYSTTVSATACTSNRTHQQFRPIRANKQFHNLQNVYVLFIYEFPSAKEAVS